MNARLHIIAPYPKGEAPSQRFRFEQYLEFLSENGVVISHHSFHSRKSWERLYKEGMFPQKFAELCWNFFRRLFLLFQLIPAEHILIHREMTHIGPPFFEWVLAKVMRKKYTFDFDDAIWLPNYSSANAKFQRLKWYGKTAKLIKWANEVTAGNQFLADYALQFNPNVRIIPTTIDVTHQHNKIADHDREPVVIGWTGTHSTMRYLDFIVPVISRLEKEFDFEFHIISNQKPDYKLKSLRYSDWKAETEIEDLSKFHIGIMPLVPDAWSEGKCGFKALQYMSLGMAAIVSPVGVNTKIVINGENGFIAETAEEWEAALRLLLSDKELRKTIGKSARKSIEENWSVDAWKKDYLLLIRKSE